MSVLVIMFFIYLAVKGDRKNIFTGRQFNIFKLFIGFIILCAVGSVALPLLAVIFDLASVVFPFWLIWYIIKKIKNQTSPSGSFNTRNDKSGTYYRSETAYSANAAKTRGRDKSDANALTKSANKRRKIINNFNKHYQLCLTETQIQRIVDASYYSADWEKEIIDMNRDYASVYEWYKSNTAWLRAYLRVFKVQSVSSDFEQQKKICIDEFNQIFQGSSIANAAADDTVIRKINDRYYTDFDDVSFMIAHRFLTQNGYKYDIKARNVMPEYEKELEELRKKYEQMPV